jgi:hypothetical protein
MGCPDFRTMSEPDLSDLSAFVAVALSLHNRSEKISNRPGKYHWTSNNRTEKTK